MDQQASLWQRVKRVLRPAGVRSERPAEAVVEEPVDDLMGVEEASLEPAGKKPLWARSGGPAPLREVSQRVVELADAMQGHFEQQDQHATQLTRSLDRVGSVLEQIAETQRAQREYLQSIAAHSEANDKHTATLSDTVGRIPESLLTQAEAIGGVARQLEAAQEGDTRLRQSLDTFGQAVDTLGSAGSAQVETLQRLNAAQNAQHEAFTNLVREQSRRFMIVIIIAAILAIGALAAVVVTLVLQMNR